MTTSDMTTSTRVTTAAGRPIRSPYWRPGMTLGEPWVALAETSAGHVVHICGRRAEQAFARVGLWHAQAEAGRGIDELRICVGGAVVDPRGTVVDSWGSAPTPGGRSRWSPITRLREPAVCGRCRRARWTGCWVDLTLDGCAACLPAIEVDDPRPWPVDPPDPGQPLRSEPKPLTVPAALKPRRSTRAAAFSAARSAATPSHVRDVV